MCGKHLLSLKDLNQSDVLEQLLDAGASSLKIEGRLKDAAYVKNVTAAYRRRLDDIFKRRKEYVKASSGEVRTTFSPQLDKSFSRGFTHYFLLGRERDVASFDTPKSLGEEMGTVKEVRGNCLTVAGVKPFSNGDGVCFIDERGKLRGFRVNRVDGNRLYPQEMPRIRPHTRLYRNFDQEFDRVLARKSAERRIRVDVELAECVFGFTLGMTDEDGHRAVLSFEMAKEQARTPQQENWCTQLGKLGNTPFEVGEIRLQVTGSWFIPSSVLADWRRKVAGKLMQVRRLCYPREVARMDRRPVAYPQRELTYLGNVMNERAAQFYREHGVVKLAPAFERQPADDAVLMFCKHCLRYSMGWCPVHQKGHSPYREPYYLVSSDGRRFRLDFDCKRCQMKVSYAHD